jgi:carboxylesterase type B
MPPAVLLLHVLFATLSVAAPPVITTSCGAVSGAVDAITLTGELAFRYESIPYAAPPVGELRFRPPQPYACPWAGVLNGSSPAPQCVQAGGAGQEDCLTLTVLTPSNHTPADPLLPVLVYFHGGNLIDGAPDPAELEVLAVRVPGSMVTVGVHYRLNLFGFLALDDLAAEDGWVANQGIADALAALEWVKREIGAFGGDASRVTIMGQSSGGTLIFALFAAPSAAGLFTGAISLSGSPNITMDATAKRAQDAPVLAALNCSSGATPAARVACLRAATPTALAAAMPRPSYYTPGIFGWSLPAGIPSPAEGGRAYAGIVHVDGVLLTMDFATALATRLVPAALIISNMEAEGDGGDGIGVRNASAAEWAAALGASFGDWTAEEGAIAAAALGIAYAAEAAVDADLAYGSINSDFGLTCAARVLAARVAAGAPRDANPVYVMFNAWTESQKWRWPNHGLDLRYMTWGWGSDFTPSASDLEAATLLQKLIGDFAVNRGVLPASWSWAPASVTPLQTFVFTETDGYPGGGPRAVVRWKEAQCAALANLSIAETFWWCD